MRVYTVPLSPLPQSFGIVMAGKEYRLTVRWFDAPEGGWTLDIAEPDNAAPIVSGIPLVTGIDLLWSYAYLDWGGGLWVDAELPPTLENLGADVDVIFVVEEDDDGDAE